VRRDIVEVRELAVQENTDWRGTEGRRQVAVTDVGRGDGLGIESEVRAVDADKSVRGVEARDVRGGVGDAPCGVDGEARVGLGQAQK
jgi:hypothetical protein